MKFSLQVDLGIEHIRFREGETAAGLQQPQDLPQRHVYLEVMQHRGTDDRIEGAFDVAVLESLLQKFNPVRRKVSLVRLLQQLGRDIHRDDRHAAGGEHFCEESRTAADF